MKASTPTVTLARADTQVAPYAQVRGIPVGADALIGPLPRLPSTAKPAAAKVDAEAMR